MDEEAVENFRLAGRIAAGIRKDMMKQATEGSDLLELALYADDRIRQEGAEPAFPVNLSIDHVAAHFTPVSRGDVLKVGDMLKIDLGVHIEGYLSDTASTVQVGVGTGHPMIAASRDALERCIPKVLPGAPVEPVGSTVAGIIRSRGFSPIENLTGHLMRRNKLHAGLSVPNVPDASDEVFPAEGAVAIEPFATDGTGHVVAGSPGNIYLFVKDGRLKTPALKESARIIKERFTHFPFTTRWLDSPKVAKEMPALVRKGAVHSYPVLVEAGHGTVTQHEHTILLHDGTAEVTTL